MSWGWDEDPSVSELRAPRADDEQPARHHRRRSTRKWCRGKVGVEHQPAIRLNRYVESLQLYPRHRPGGARVSIPPLRPVCGWLDWSWRIFEGRYLCRHERYCVNCGKILAQLENEECPDYKPRKD